MEPAPIDLITGVRTVLSGFATRDVPDVTDDLALRRHLGIDEDLGRKALAAPFQRIATRYRADAIVTRSECSNLETVKDCVVLVASKAGFEYRSAR
jgi:hypothetical protein